MPALGFLHQRELLVGVPALALPLRHLRAVAGRAGVVQAKATGKVYKVPEAIAQRDGLPFLVGIAAAVGPQPYAIAVGGRSLVVPDQAGSVTVEDGIVAAARRRSELPLLVVLLIAAGPLLQERAVAGPPTAGVHAEPAGLVDHLIPGVGIDRTRFSSSSSSRNTLGTA